MATGKVKSRPKSGPSPSPSRRLFQILSILIVATLISVLILQYGLFTNLDSFPADKSDSENLENERYKSLYNDLDEATKPFGRSHFDLKPPFDGKPIWGSLNSGHYFGLKLSSPNSIESSLMWFRNNLNRDGQLDIRHLCNQNDGLNSYSWNRHDFHTFGEQIIEDNGFRLITRYVKKAANSTDWQARIDIEQIDNRTKATNLSVIQYLTTNHLDDNIKLESQPAINIPTGANPTVFSLIGFSKDVGDFKFVINFDSDRDNFIRGSYLVGNYDKNRLPLSTYIHSQMTVKTIKGSTLFLLPGRNSPGEPHKPDNVIAYQMILKVPATFRVEFASSSEKIDFEQALNEKTRDFDEKFSRTFRVYGKESSDVSENAMDRLAKIALSNMLGGIGYFHGHSYIGSSVHQEKVAKYGPIQLLTAVPSRSFFPRGFLWDEGFHNLLISEWDSDLSNKIIRSWFNLMNANGWIPREVILGSESMRRVPHEFIIQRIANANPPSMLIAIERMLEKQSLSRETLEEIYPKLKAWYAWFNATQSGIKHGTFRWRGRDELSVNMLNPKTLTSGLDDYPRASHPSPSEYHIDLRSWMGLAARVLARLASHESDHEFSVAISKEAAELTDNRILDGLHWNNHNQMYCDFGYNTNDTKLVRVMKTRKNTHSDKLESYQVYERQSSGHPEFGCVAEFGYVSLFPLMMRSIEPDSEKLGIILDRLRDVDELWSDYGVRSLSKSSRYYRKYNTEHDKPYWRGAIWINLNYLILSSLEYYSKVDGPNREKCSIIFKELKENLVTNVLKEFTRTNYIWENYDDLTGQGQGSHPFTGWSSLILLIMSSNLR